MAKIEEQYKCYAYHNAKYYEKNFGKLFQYSRQNKGRYNDSFSATEDKMTCRSSLSWIKTDHIPLTMIYILIIIQI